MKTLKRQFKEFWLYFKCVRKGVYSSSGALSKQNIFALILVIIAFIMFSMQTGFFVSGFSFDLSRSFFIGAALGVGLTAGIKPSLLSVAPFSPKQRVVFSYISTALLAIICCVFWIACMLAFFSVIGLFAFIFSGENIFVVSEDIIKKSAYYEGWDALFGIYMYLSVYAISFLQGAKRRNIVFAVWFAVTEALILVLVNVCNAAAQTGDGKFLFFTSVNEQIDCLALPWLPVLITGILAALAFAASLATSIIFFRSKKL